MVTALVLVVVAATSFALYGKGGGPDVELNLKAQCTTEPSVTIFLGPEAAGKST
jgi:hypothetical protein